MQNQNAGYEVIKNMYFLITHLHKEWDRSGKTRAEAIITLEEAEPIYRKLSRHIAEKQHILDEEKMTFEQSIELSKENYIILRIVKKMRKTEKRTNKMATELEFSIELDAEEYQIFRTIILEKE